MLECRGSAPLQAVAHALLELIIWFGRVAEEGESVVR